MSENNTNKERVVTDEPDFYLPMRTEKVDYRGLSRGTIASYKNDLRFWRRSEKSWLDAHRFWSGRNRTPDVVEHLERVEKAIVRARKHITDDMNEIAELKQRNEKVIV